MPHEPHELCKFIVKKIGSKKQNYLFLLSYIFVSWGSILQVFSEDVAVDKGCWVCDIADIKVFDQKSHFIVTGTWDTTKLTGLPPF